MPASIRIGAAIAYVGMSWQGAPMRAAAARHFGAALAGAVFFWAAK